MLLFSRRRFLGAMAVTAHLARSHGLGAQSIRHRLPDELPAGVAAIIESTLKRAPGELNTDWFGTILLDGLLRWHVRGIKEVRPFALDWLKHHLNSGQVSRYSGPRSREFSAGGIRVTTYAGQFGLAFPCYEMARQFQDARAAEVTDGIARMILHRTTRNHLGLVAHDDRADFAIPDTCFFATEALMDAYALAPESGQAFRDEAVIQLRSYIDTFLVSETGLARTVLRGDKLGDTYWTRASGWLLWSITSVLRHLPQTDTSRKGFLEDLERLSSGMARVQDRSGGFHVLLDEPETPLETTGAAMYAAGVHEAIRKGWLSTEFSSSVEQAWQFVKQNLTDDGRVRNAYTGWAIPAEDRQIDSLMDVHDMGWIPGFMLRTADELTTSLERQ